jgi:CRP/FNR family cyclic AMP-dependent transcriptional regulator|eukprot:COSAG01_NODE_1623_length_9708_cov_32.044438_12_plen_162_part_00
MRSEFSSIIYEKFVAQIPLFRGLPVGLIHSICNLAEPMLAVRHQVIFSEGTTGKEMYLLLEGELEISVAGERLGFLSDGAFFGEVPILDMSTAAEIRTRTVTAMTECHLCFFEKYRMQAVKQQYPELALRLKRCARVRKNQTINRKGIKFKATMEEAKRAR